MSDVLLQQLYDYRASVREAARINPFLDLDECERIIEVMLDLLAKWDEFTAHEQEAIRSTVAYVVATDDEEHDLRSPIGFVDDAERVDELLAALGQTRPER